ncbi:MAG TPA: hypothetical protein VKT82_00930 [Ktedonobacterales bacterium]|nr:hypothetical protein [Ktedonobacterales bacterium]
MTYGGTAPNFQAQLTVPAGENPLKNPSLFNFMIDSQDYGADTSSSSGSTYTFTLRGSSLPNTPPLASGQHAVVTSYFSIPLNETLESAPITLTVQKLTPTLNCEILFLPTFATKASVTFTLSTETGPAVDWQDATYTMTFIGSQTFTDTHLTADSAGNVTALTPPVPGKYKFRCTFNGTANFTSASVVGSSTVVVSANHQPIIKLYSNPTTIRGGQSTALEIVVSGAPGLPTPTGQFGLYMGNMFIRPTNLGPNGSTEIQTTFPNPLPANTIRVDYFGDPVYAQSNANFSLTNPPIPAGSGNPNPTPTSTSTATATPTGGSTPTPSNTTTANGGKTSANGGTTSGNHPTDTPSNQGSPVFWIILIVLLVLAAFGSGAFIVLGKRARAASTPATATLPLNEDV